MSSAQRVLSRHLSDILVRFISYILNYEGNLVIAIFTLFLFLCSICQWNLISAVFCHRLIVWNKLHLRLLHRKNGERLQRRKLVATTTVKRDGISQTLIDLKYQPQVWERKRRANLKRLTHSVQVPGWTPGTSFHITKFKFCVGLHGFAFKNGKKTTKVRPGFTFVQCCYCTQKSTEVCRDSWNTWDKVFLFHSLTKRPALTFLQYILYWQVQLPPL